MKLTDEELAGVKNDNCDIQFSKIMEFRLPRLNCAVVDNGAFDPERPPVCTSLR